MEELITCFVVEPIRYKGKRVIDRDVDLTPEQVAHCQKFAPCPIRVKEAPAPVGDEGGTDPSQDGSKDDAPDSVGEPENAAATTDDEGPDADHEGSSDAPSDSAAKPAPKASTKPAAKKGAAKK